MPHVSLSELERLCLSIAYFPPGEQIRALEMQYAVEWETLREMRPQEKDQLVPAAASLAIIAHSTFAQRIFGPSHLQRLQSAFGKVWAAVDGIEELRGRGPDPARTSGRGLVLPIPMVREFEAFDIKMRR